MVNLQPNMQRVERLGLEHDPTLLYVVVFFNFVHCSIIMIDGSLVIAIADRDLQTPDR
jgi:hypothetical protein